MVRRCTALLEDKQVTGELLGCHNNCCSWYSAVLIIFMANYKVLVQD